MYYSRSLYEKAFKLYDQYIAIPYLLKSIMDEKYQADFPNSHKLSNIDNLNMTNQSVQRNRLPTLGEILANKTKPPVSLHNFYDYMKVTDHNSDYLDFWFDLVNHLNLCKHYIRGLRESIVRQSYNGNRHSMPILDRSKAKSVSSSILLDLILNDNFLQDDDSRRLSKFLRGDLEVNPRLSELISIYDEQTVANNTGQTEQAGHIGYAGYTGNDSTTSIHSPVYNNTNGNRVSSNSRLLEDDSYVSNQLNITDADKSQVFSQPKYMPLEQPPRKRISSVNPSTIEKLIKNSPDMSERSSFITRDNLKESSKNLLLKYFVEDSEKDLNLPGSLKNEIIRAIEVEGRDDPDAFSNVKIYVFNRLENYYLPNFLDLVAIKNINRTSNNFLVSYGRIILGFFFLFIGFWMSYIFLFLNYSKGKRLYIIIPFIISAYCLISSIYFIDPILVWLGYSESFTSENYLIKIKEKFIHRLLIKRSLWVTALILLFTAVFTVLFSLVPGHRL
mgnify:CR=1 FL=1